MRSIDLKSVAVAGAIGALALVAIAFFIADDPTASTPPKPMGYIAGAGFVVGALTQIGVRVVGVS